MNALDRPREENRRTLEPGILKVLVLCVPLTLFGVAACGSTKSEKSTPAKVVDKQAGWFTKKTNLKVVNRSGRDMKIDICHDGVCNGVKTIRDGESDEAAGENINGWVKSDWGVGNGNQQNQYTGVMGNAPGPYQIDFTAGNPDVGLPWIEARLPEPCYWHTSSTYKNPAKWPLGVNDKLQSPSDSLCTYTMVGSRAEDGGADDYKMLTLEAYAPVGGWVSYLGCSWELTPGPIRLPESPDGSWSCWVPGPKPPSGTATVSSS